MTDVEQMLREMAVERPSPELGEHIRQIHAIAETPRLARWRTKGLGAALAGCAVVCLVAGFLLGRTTSPSPVDPLGKASRDIPSAPAIERTRGSMRTLVQRSDAARESERADLPATPAEPPRLSPAMAQELAQAKPLRASRRRDPPPLLLTTDHEIMVLLDLKYD